MSNLLPVSEVDKSISWSLNIEGQKKTSLLDFFFFFGGGGGGGGGNKKNT